MDKILKLAGYLIFRSFSGFYTQNCTAVMLKLSSLTHSKIKLEYMKAYIRGLEL